MSGLRIQEAAAARWEELRARLLSGLERFRESRLYVQTVCTLVLVSAALLTHWLPYGPLVRLGWALKWTVREDYDFRGKASEWGDWVRSRGGWNSAARGFWQQGVDRVRSWVPEPYAWQEGRSPNGRVQQSVSPNSVNAAPEVLPPQGSASSLAVLPPVRPVEGSVLSDYGWLPPGAGEEFHEGIDFWANTGTSVVAVLDGQVMAIRQDARLGTLVEIRHGDVVAVYAQVSGLKVHTGDEIRRGQSIAAVAVARGTEQHMRPHLHFEIRPVTTGEPVDPASYLGLGGKKL